MTTPNDNDNNTDVSQHLDHIQEFHVIPFVLLTLFTFYLAYTAEDGKAIKALIKDFHSKRFISLLLVVAVSAYIGFTNPNIRGKIATQHALVSFIVAYFAHLDMPFASYFLIFVLVYYTEGWI